MVSVKHLSRFALCMQGMSIRSIADLRRMQRDSVESYLAEAITAGKEYAWHRMHVPRRTLAAVAAAAARALGTAAAACASAPPAGAADGPITNALASAVGPSAELSGADAAGPQAASATIRGAVVCGEHDDCCVGGATGVFDASKGNCMANADALGLSSAPLGAAARESAEAEPCLRMQQDDAEKENRCSHAQTAIASVGVTSAASRQAGGVMGAGHLQPGAGADLVKLLQEKGCAVKTLKDSMLGSVSYGHIRLCLAHIERLQMLQELLAEGSDNFGH